MQKMHSLKLLDRDLGQPLQDGLSLSDFIDRVREIEPPTWYGNSSGCTSSHRYNSLPHCSCWKPHRCTRSPKPSGEASPNPFGPGFGSSFFGGAPKPSGEASAGGLFGRASPSPPGPASGESLFDVASPKLFGEVSSKPLFSEPFGESSSVLKERIQAFVRRVERELEGLELSNYI